MCTWIIDILWTSDWNRVKSTLCVRSERQFRRHCVLTVAWKTNPKNDSWKGDLNDERCVNDMKWITLSFMELLYKFKLVMNLCLKHWFRSKLYQNVVLTQFVLDIHWYTRQLFMNLCVCSYSWKWCFCVDELGFLCVQIVMCFIVMHVCSL